MSSIPANQYLQPNGAQSLAQATLNANNAGMPDALGAVMGAGAYLSPEEFLAMAQQQLGEADTQIRSLMSTIQQNRFLAGKLSEISNRIRALKGKDGAEAEKAELDELKAAKQEAKELGFNELAAQIDYTLTLAEKKLFQEKKGTLEAQNFEDLALKIDAKANELTSGVDIGMIKLQSLMQQRSQILTLASNAIAALNETAKTAISNIRS
jgi:hypothetical protein